MPCDERPEAAIEKRCADGLNVDEVKAHAAGGFQRFGDLVVDLLRVDTRPHPTAIIAQLNDLHRCATRWAFDLASPATPADPYTRLKPFATTKPTTSSAITPAVTFSCVHIPVFALHAAIEHIRDICGHPLPTT